MPENNDNEDQKKKTLKRVLALIGAILVLLAFLFTFVFINSPVLSWLHF